MLGTHWDRREALDAGNALNKLKISTRDVSEASPRLCQLTSGASSIVTHQFSPSFLNSTRHFGQNLSLGLFSSRPLWYASHDISTAIWTSYPSGHLTRRLDFPSTNNYSLSSPVLSVTLRPFERARR